MSIADLNHKIPFKDQQVANLRRLEPRQRGWEHPRVFRRRLKELVPLQGLCGVHVRGASDYPPSARVGSWDPRYMPPSSSLPLDAPRRMLRCDANELGLIGRRW